MDKLKYVKLEQPDGSYSDSIPLAVDADYVDVNGDSLTNVLGKKADNTDIDILQTEINSLASGSPKGSYATVSDLTTDNPATGVYVIQADGHIYSWTKDGQNTIDLGTYQATEVADNSVTPIKATFFNKSNNLIYKWLQGIGLMGQTGIEYENPIMCVSNFFNVNPDKFLNLMVNEVVSGYLYRIYYFDENKSFLSSVSLINNISNNNIDITPVSNARYARLQLTNNNSGAENCTIPQVCMISIVDNKYTPDKYISPFLLNKELIEKKPLTISDLDETLKTMFKEIGNNIQLSFTNGALKSYKDRSDISNNSYSNTTINVSEGEVYKITGYSYFAGKLFFMYDNNNMLIDFYPKTYGGSRKDSVFVTIPDNVTQLTINSLNSSPTQVKRITKFETNSILQGKIIAVNGDSLCEGNANNGISFADLIAEKFNMTLDKTAVGGATIATGTTWQDSTPRHYISTSIENMNINADYVIIGGGVNDYWQNVPLGNITDRMSSQIDNATFYGGLEQMCRNLLNRYPEKKIGFIIYHKINRIFKTNNSLNLKYIDYYNAILNVLDKYSIPCLDLSKISCLNTEIFYFKDNYTCNQDGVHPNTTGYEKFYNDKIIKWLESL